jgi:CubicO group peptidase (beta-lactamase class C family)
VLSWPADGRAGEKYEYNYLIPEVLGLVLERATGVRYADYLSKRIWIPAGNRDAEVWLDRPGGAPYHNAAMFASAHDWLNLGILLASNGRVAGQQVLPEAWIKEITTPSKTNPNFGFLALGSPHLKERRLSDRVNYYSLVSEPLLRNDVVIVDGYIHRIFAVPSEQLVVLYVGTIRRPAPGAPPNVRWDDALLLNPILQALKPISAK